MASFFPSYPDPYAAYERLRAEASVAWHAPFSFWTVVNHADVQAALTHPAFSSDRLRERLELLSRDPANAPLTELLSSWILFLDPPRHTRLRSPLMEAISKDWLERCAGRGEELAKRLLKRGGTELISEFAVPFPVIAIGEMLGAEESHLAKLAEYARQISLFVNNSRLVEGEALGSAVAAARELREYFTAVIEARKLSPRDDLASRILAAAQKSEAGVDEAGISTVALLFYSGLETVTNLIGNGIHVLLRHPDQLKRLRAEPGRIAAAADEILRFESPVQAVSRVCLESISFGGKELKKGDTVLLLLGAANRDPKVFERPAEFDIARPSQRHLAFGFGAHFCPAAILGKQLGEAALRVFFELYPVAGLAPDFQPVWRRDFFFRGLSRLPIQ